MTTLSLADYQQALASLQQDPRYVENLDWGEPRSGHPEGTVRAHIAEISQNLAQLRPRLSELEDIRLQLLIHTHDTFKKLAAANVPIVDPRSHASLGRAFLAEFCPDSDLLAMVQWHDEPFALWRQVESKGACNPQRFEAMLQAIEDWRLFAAFQIVDGCTAGKSRAPLQWLLQTLAGRVAASWGPGDIL